MAAGQLHAEGGVDMLPDERLKGLLHGRGLALGPWNPVAVDSGNLYVSHRVLPRLARN